MNTKQYQKKDSSYGKIRDDFFYYNKLYESLSRIYPSSSKYGEELAQISMSLQKIYEKITMELKSCKNCKETSFNVKQEEETKFG